MQIFTRCVCMWVENQKGTHTVCPLWFGSLRFTSSASCSGCCYFEISFLFTRFSFGYTERAKDSPAYLYAQISSNVVAEWCIWERITIKRFDFSWIFRLCLRPFGWSVDWTVSFLQNFAISHAVSNALQCASMRWLRFIYLHIHRCAFIVLLGWILGPFKIATFRFIFFSECAVNDTPRSFSWINKSNNFFCTYRVGKKMAFLKWLLVWCVINLIKINWFSCVKAPPWMPHSKSLMLACWHVSQMHDTIVSLN